MPHTINRISRLFAVLILGAALSLGFILYKERLFPPPLSLPPGVEVSARWRLEGEGPFRIGDLIPVCFEVEAVNGVDLRLLSLSAVDLDGLELVEEENPVTNPRQGGWQRTTRYLLSPWQTGTYYLAPKEITYRNTSGVEATVVADPLELTVVSLLPANLSAEEQAALTLKEDKGPVGLPPNYRLLALVLTVVLFIILLFILFRRIFRRRTEKEHLPAETLPPSEPAHLIALRRLAALKQSGFMEKGHFKAYYSELSACLREYLENRFHFPALEMTTPEILHSPQITGVLTSQQYADLSGVLQASDLVKFAKHLPTQNSASGCYLTVERFIDETKEKPPVVDQSPEEKKKEEYSDRVLGGKKYSEE